MTDIFISYSRKDDPFVRKLSDGLANRGREIWVDWEDIPPTADWFEKIKAGIEASRALIFVLSPDSVTSAVCKREVDHALANHKRLIPIIAREVVADKVDESIGKLNWIFFREQDDISDALNKLLQAVDTDLEWVDAHTTLLEKALEWERKNRDQSLLLRGQELDEAEAWQVKSAEKEPKPTELMGEFILSSRQGESRRQRLLLLGVTAALIISVTLGSIAVWQYLKAEQKTRQANAGRLAISAEKEMDEHIDLALLLANEAVAATDPKPTNSLDKGLVWMDKAFVGGYEPTVEAQSTLFSLLWPNYPPLQKILRGHKGPVLAVAFSPDGKRLASASSDRTVQIWNAENGHPLGESLKGYAGEVTTVSFSADGKLLASGSRDSSMRIWNVENNEPISLAAVRGHVGNDVKSVAFSPKGKLLAWAGSTGVELLDAESGNSIDKPLWHYGRSRHVNNVAFSPDGQSLALASTAKVELLNTESGQLLGSPLWHQNKALHESVIVRSVAFRPDGKLLASGGYDTPVFLWDTVSQTLFGEPLRGHEGWVDSVAFSPDGKRLASGSWDKTIRLWDARTGKRLGEPLKGFENNVTSVVFSPDSRRLASASLDGTVRLWHGQEQHFGYPISDLDFLVSVEFSPDGHRLIETVDGVIRLWDLDRGKYLGSPYYTIFPPMIVNFSPDGKLVALAEDANVRLYDVLNGKEIGQALKHDSKVLMITFSSNSRYLATASSDKTVRIWDIQGRDPVNKLLKNHGSNVLMMALSPDSRYLALASEDNSLRLWDTRSGQPLCDSPKVDGSKVTAMTISIDGKLLAWAGEYGTIGLWDIIKGQPFGEPIKGRHQGKITSIAFSPDSKRLASASTDSTVQLWDTVSGLPLGQPLRGHEYDVLGVVFSQDGGRLFSAGSDRTVREWDVEFHAWQQRACDVANRNLDFKEWRDYFGDEPYRKTCDGLPGPEECD